MSNPIATENANIGTQNWLFSQVATTQIQCYCDKTSYNPGDTVTFFVSVQVNTTTWTGSIFRLGWYGGTGARLIATIPQQTGVAQGYWDGAVLQSCPTAIIDATTHNLEAGWASSYSWSVPGGAVTGVYLAVFTDANGKQWSCSFTVKGNTTADYVVMRSYATDAAYNAWGGYSLYTNPTVGVKVSLNRPGANFGGSSNLLKYDLQCIRWLERMGYNLSYISDIDMHSSPAQLLNYKAILAVGHNEYWTKSMRDGMEAAIAAKVSAGFLAANSSYWQARFENDAASNPNRTITCYKVLTTSSNLANDPQYGVNNAVVTSQWRDAVINRSENTMIGIQYTDFFASEASNVAWTTDASMDTTYTAGSGLAANTSYGAGLVGYEWDDVFSGGPASLKVIGTTAVTGSSAQPTHSKTTWYRASSGALVFASGSVSWTWALDGYRWFNSTANTVPQMQQLMANIMGALKGPVYGNLGH